ncbi:MAG: hypothetical protein OHK0052_01670 [Anaerolineales bacterium]
MDNVVTLIIAQETQQALETISAQDGVSSDQIIAQALEEYLFFWRLRTLRERMILKAQAQGILNEEDVFERVS